MSEEIKIGQIWKDRDKRREKEGTVRSVRVVAVGETCITCQTGTKTYWFNRRRFGSKAVNDSFELVQP